MSRESNPLRTAFVVAVSVLALVQMGAVTLSSLPDNRYSEAAEPFTSYLGRYFSQNWRLFAPSPVSADRGVALQGTYVDETGNLLATPWVDWTDVELDLVRHHVIGNRGGYTTSKLYGTLKDQLGDLDDRQTDIATRDDPENVPTWKELKSELTGPAAGTEPVDDDVVSFLRYEAAVTRLGTSVLEARWPDRDFVAVRFAIRSQAVTPYDERHGTDSERAAARPEPDVMVRGWRTPLHGSEAERRAVADFDRRHR